MNKNIKGMERVNLIIVVIAVILLFIIIWAFTTGRLP